MICCIGIPIPRACLLPCICIICAIFTKKNLLVQPNGIELAGEGIDVRRITTPSYFLSTREDHIAPWKSTYAATQLFKGAVTFVLAASGHIAGVVNPPAKKKYSFWAGEKLLNEPEQWLEQAKETQGSWWEHWQAWQEPFAGGKIPARKPGDGALQVLGDAPGEYVKENG